MEVTGSLLAVLLSVASRSSFSLCEARRSGRSGWLTVDRHSPFQWCDLWLHVVINEGFSQCLPLPHCPRDASVFDMQYDLGSGSFNIFLGDLMAVKFQK